MEKPVENLSEQSETEDTFTFIKRYRSKNNGTVANLNLNSIPDEFSSLKEIMSNNIDILVIQETKVDKTFLKGFFDIPGYKQPSYENKYSRWRNFSVCQRGHTLKGIDRN